MVEMIYKICPKSLWQDAVSQGVFHGAGIDIADGYIHFSTKEQAAETARLHFAGQSDLVLVEIAVSEIDITWEASRGGQLFPHLYDSLPLSATRRIWDLPLSEDGIPQLPDLN